MDEASLARLFSEHPGMRRAEGIDRAAAVFAIARGADILVAIYRSQRIAEWLTP
jgi:hypothetical protein